jgi:hypothetical protein
MTQLLEDVKLSEWKVGPQQRNIHGGYFWPINLNTTQLHPRIQLVDAKDQLRIPFAPGNKFNDGGRKSLDYSLDRDYIIDFFDRVDDFVLEHVWKNVTEFFKKPPETFEVLKQCYSPLISRKNDYEPLLKTKVNDGALVFIIEDQTEKVTQKSDIFAITPNSTGCPIITVDKIWMLGGGSRFGVTLLTSALLLTLKKEKTTQDIFFGALF